MEKHHNRKFITELVEILDYREYNDIKEIVVKPVPLVVSNIETGLNETKTFETEFKITKENSCDFSTFTASLIGKNKEKRTEIEVNESDLKEYGIEKSWLVISSLFNVAKEQSRITKKPVSITGSVSYIWERRYCHHKGIKLNCILVGFTPLRYNLHYTNLLQNAGYIARKQNLFEVNSLIYVFGYIVSQGEMINQENYTENNIEAFKIKKQEIVKKLFLNSNFDQNDNFSYMLEEEHNIKYIVDLLEWDNSLEQKIDNFIIGLLTKRSAQEILLCNLPIKLKIIKIINEIFVNINKMLGRNE